MSKTRCSWGTIGKDGYERNASGASSFSGLAFPIYILLCIYLTALILTPLNLPFECDSGDIEIPIEQLFDGNDDCPDGSDEKTGGIISQSRAERHDIDNRNDGILGAIICGWPLMYLLGALLFTPDDGFLTQDSKKIANKKIQLAVGHSGCRRPPSSGSPYCYIHKGEVSKNLRKKAAKTRMRIEAENAAATRRRNAAKRAAATRKRNAAKAAKREAWEGREPKLRAIAEEVISGFFTDVKSFTIDLDDEVLIITKDFPTFVRKWWIRKALTRSYASFRREMEEVKEKWNKEEYDGPPPRYFIGCRNSWCSAPVTYSRMWGHGQYCVNCETDDC